MCGGWDWWVAREFNLVGWALCTVPPGWSMHLLHLHLMFATRALPRRRHVLLCCGTASEVVAALSDVSQLRAVPLMQAVLFPAGPAAGPAATAGAAAAGAAASGVAAAAAAGAAPS